MAENDQVAAIARSHAEWASLRRRLETVTPAMLARAGLTVGAGLVVLAVAAGYLAGAHAVPRRRSHRLLGPAAREPS